MSQHWERPQRHPSLCATPPRSQAELQNKCITAFWFGITPTEGIYVQSNRIVLQRGGRTAWSRLTSDCNAELWAELHSRGWKGNEDHSVNEPWHATLLPKLNTPWTERWTTTQKNKKTTLRKRAVPSSDCARPASATSSPYIGASPPFQRCRFTHEGNCAADHKVETRSCLRQLRR